MTILVLCKSLYELKIGYFIIHDQAVVKSFSKTFAKHPGSLSVSISDPLHVLSYMPYYIPLKAVLNAIMSYYKENI